MLLSTGVLTPSEGDDGGGVNAYVFVLLFTSPVARNGSLGRCEGVPDAILSLRANGEMRS